MCSPAARHLWSGRRHWQESGRSIHQRSAQKPPLAALVARQPPAMLQRQVEVGARCVVFVFAEPVTGTQTDARARRARGNRKDRLQYAAGHAIALAIPALFATILIDRAMRG